MALFAPKPMLVIGALRGTDSEEFPFDETGKAVVAARRVYRLYGAGDSLEIRESSTSHGYQEDKRERLYAFVERHFLGRGQEISRELPATIETLRDLAVGIPSGNTTLAGIYAEWFAKPTPVPALPEGAAAANTLVGGDARPLDNRSVNTTLVWDAPQNARLTLNSYYNRVEGSQTAYSAPSGPTNYIDDVQLNVNSIAVYQYYGSNLKGEFDLTDNTRLTALVAYDRKRGEASGDGDFGFVDFIRVTDGRDLRDTYTGELRFDTHWSDRFSTLVGVFADVSDDTSIVYRSLLGTPLPPSIGTSNLASQAIYANAFFNLTDTLELSGGLRFDHQEVEASGTSGRYGANEWEPRVTLTQHWTPNHMTYASISRGFRGGGANAPGAPNAIYQGDSVWTYEIGDKFNTADHTLQLNTAIYYNDYSHYIGQNSLTPSLIAVNLNTGSVSSYGFEAEGFWRPNDVFELRGGLTYNHARITDDSEYAAVIGHGLPSDRILFQPDWNFFVTPSLTFQTGNDSDIRLDTTVTYKGDRAGSSLSPTVSPMLDGYYLVNGNLAYEHDNWTIALWGTNLTDERYYESYLDSSLLSAFGFSGPLVHNLGITGDRRRIGVRVSARF